MKYNGYANYETWCVNLWLSNEEASYTYWRDAAREVVKEAPHSQLVSEGLANLAQATRWHLAEQLKNSLTEGNPLDAPDVYSDLLNAALSEVDWQEIADQFLEDLEQAPAQSVAHVSSGLGAARFELGRVVATVSAKESLTEKEIAEALSRHARGDWGLVAEVDREENEFSLKEGFRLMSVYESADKARFWVITEADRSVTTVLLPEDY